MMFKIPDEIREMAALVAKYGNPMLSKCSQEKGKESDKRVRRQVGALPKGKIVQKHFVNWAERRSTVSIRRRY